MSEGASSVRGQGRASAGAAAPGVGRASAPGTCGELAQGWYRGRWLQVTCPVDLHVQAWAELGSEAPLRDGGAGEGEWTGSKARRAARWVLERLGWGEADIALRVRSPIPRGKGMGSSTADVVAAAAATARAVGQGPGPDLLADAAVSVEPSDGIMIPGVALFDHAAGEVREPLGDPPPLEGLVGDPGGVVDTVLHHARRGDGGRSRARCREVAQWKGAFADVLHGVTTGDPEAVGRGATVSARIHEEREGTGLVSRLEGLAREVGAVGVNAAHSGTVRGLLFPGGCREPDAEERVRRAVPEAVVTWTRVVSGGVGGGP